MYTIYIRTEIKFKIINKTVIYNYIKLEHIVLLQILLAVTFKFIY